MKFYKNLYVSKLVENKKDKIIEKLKQKDFPMILCYIIVLLEEGEKQMEFYSTGLLHQKQLERDDLFIVGLAAGYRDAIHLVQEITSEVYEETGGADIRAYIREKEMC